jgi:hypothetical protein
MDLEKRTRGAGYSANGVNTEIKHPNTFHHSALSECPTEAIGSVNRGGTTLVPVAISALKFVKPVCRKAQPV